jgi:hypothetical protein
MQDLQSIAELEPFQWHIVLPLVWKALKSFEECKLEGREKEIEFEKMLLSVSKLGPTP